MKNKLFFYHEMSVSKRIELMPVFAGSKQQQRETKYNKKNEEIQVIKFAPIKEHEITDAELITLREFVKNYELVINEDEIKNKIRSFIDIEEVDIVGLKKYVNTLSDTNIIKELQVEIYTKYNIALTPKQIKALLEI